MSSLPRQLRRVPDAAGRRARNRWARRSARAGAGVVLLYHRIASPAYDPWDVAVSEAAFEEHLRYLTADCTVLPLGELIAAGRERRLPERAVAVTFDDGYADNLERALPLLERHGVPATIYIATGYIESRREYWSDTLLDALAGSGERPATLELDLGGHRVAASTATEEERRQALLGVIHPALRACERPALESGIAQLREWAGLGDQPVGSAEDPLRRPMSAEELTRLNASEAIELGAHTVSHPSMTALSAEANREEVEGSRDYLEKLFGKAPVSFAYPFGDNNTRARKAVAEAGFDDAVAVRGNIPLTAAARRFEVPRTIAVDEPAEDLGRRIDRTLAFEA